MHLQKFIYINWGNIPHLEFEMGPVNLLSGGNGSGKTTAADAIQTIMTAAHENLFQYNPGQDETTQRGRGGKRVRTLASYVLGCDDGSFARTAPTDGYLAALFHPTEGESGDPFTAIIAVRAWLDNSSQPAVARQDDIKFLLLPGEQLSIDDFMTEVDAQKQTIPLPALVKYLQGHYGAQQVESYDTKKAYLRRLYGLLRGLAEPINEREAMSAARAFSRFMAYKPVQSIDRFVSDEILEQKDLGEAIRSISSQLKTIHGMERDAATLVESIEILGRAREHSLQYIEQWLELRLKDYTLAQHQYQSQQQSYLDIKQQQHDLNQAISENKQAIELAVEREKQVHELRVQVEAKRLGIPVLQQQDEIKQQQQTLHDALLGHSKELLQQDHLLQQNLTHTQHLASTITDSDLKENLAPLLIKEVHQRGQALLQQPAPSFDISTLIGQDLFADLSQLESQLDQAYDQQRLHNQWFDFWHSNEGVSPYQQLERLRQLRDSQLEQAAHRVRQKQREIDRLESHQVTYPSYVERAISAIYQQCPQSDPRVLCDHLEVTDPLWQNAIEGYMGAARFSILVNPEYEAEAIRILRQMSGKDNRARVIQASKAQKDAERYHLDDRSIAHVLQFSHASAKHYVQAMYGNVMRVNSAEELTQTRRGLTADGMAAGGYSMWRCDINEAELVFGHGARERALTAKQHELTHLEQEWQYANERFEKCAQLLTAISSIRSLQYADSMRAMLNCQRQLKQLDTELKQLDTTAHDAIEQELSGLLKQESKWRKERDELSKHQGELNNQLKIANDQCNWLSDQKETSISVVETAEEDLRQLSKQWPDFHCEEKLTFADQNALSRERKVIQQEQEALQAELRISERALEREISQHNQSCHNQDAVRYPALAGDPDNQFFGGICKVRERIDELYNQIKNNILVERHSELQRLKESFNNAFVTNLCHSIHQALNDGNRQIAHLNEELVHHRFGADREYFRFDSDWIPEYRDYARFFEEVIKNPALGEQDTLFSAELSQRSTLIREQMMAMLLDEDEVKALKELERIADYRNYKRYEIYKEVEGKEPLALSEYGTGSGGQLETPAYIIRAAAITSAFRFGEGDTHLRMVLVDEAFSKMDETRSREVIHYLTDTLGLQLLFIMPTSKCGPFMDLISNEFVFAKIPSETPRGQLHTRVLVDRKVCNQEKIQTLWKQHKQTIQRQGDLNLDFMQDVLALGET